MWRRVPCEQQLNMGQSALRDTVKTVPESPGELEWQAGCFPKGNWVNIPKPRHGDRPSRVNSGNAS